ncbi:UNVERIFIED_CONTAM: hypothetical protein NCL1_21000 [Trichonephila clavipes]
MAVYHIMITLIHKRKLCVRYLQNNIYLYSNDFERIKLHPGKSINHTITDSKRSKDEILLAHSMTRARVAVLLTNLKYSKTLLINYDRAMKKVIIFLSEAHSYFPFRRTVRVVPAKLVPLPLHRADDNEYFASLGGGGVGHSA